MDKGGGLPKPLKPTALTICSVCFGVRHITHAVTRDKGGQVVISDLSLFFFLVVPSRLTWPGLEAFDRLLTGGAPPQVRLPAYLVRRCCSCAVLEHCLAVVDIACLRRIFDGTLHGALGDMLLTLFVYAGNEYPDGESTRKHGERLIP